MIRFELYCFCAFLVKGICEEVKRHSANSGLLYIVKICRFGVRYYVTFITNIHWNKGNRTLTSSYSLLFPTDYLYFVYSRDARLFGSIIEICHVGQEMPYQYQNGLKVMEIVWSVALLTGFGPDSYGA